MALAQEQRRNARILLRQVQRSPSKRKRRLGISIIEAGLVESGLRNLSYGDLDSVGILQERSHYGSVARRRNPRLAGRRFVREAVALERQGFRGGPGRLAQAVQRSAHPERYRERSGEAKGILRRLGGASGGGGRRSGAFAAGGGTLPMPGEAADPTALAALLTGAQRQLAPVSNPPEPGYSARRNVKLPAGYVAPSNPPPVLKPALAEQLQLVRALSGPEFPNTAPGSGGGGGGGSRATGSRQTGRGRVVGSPKDRAGARTRPGVIRFVKNVSGILGEPITLGTGTAHSRLTASGNVSAHWTGGALDLPMGGRKLTRAGRAALRAAGMPRRQARRADGGIYNVGNWQIIFNADDHWDHLHVGRRGG